MVVQLCCFGVAAGSARDSAMKAMWVADASFFATSVPDSAVWISFCSCVCFGRVSKSGVTMRAYICVSFRVVFASASISSQTTNTTHAVSTRSPTRGMNIIHVRTARASNTCTQHASIQSNVLRNFGVRPPRVRLAIRLADSACTTNLSMCCHAAS